MEDPRSLLIPVKKKLVKVWNTDSAAPLHDITNIYNAENTSPSQKISERTIDNFFQHEMKCADIGFMNDSGGRGAYIQMRHT